MWKIAEIRLKQLEKSFEVSKNSHPVLRRFSTDLDTEKITVILGRSGCGKTTLLRVLAGLETLDGGQILFEQPEKLGVVFQEPRLMPWLTLEQNILFGADKKKHSKSKLKEKAETLLKLTGLEKFGKAYPDQTYRFSRKDNIPILPVKIATDQCNRDLIISQCTV